MYINITRARTYIHTLNNILRYKLYNNNNNNTNSATTRELCRDARVYACNNNNIKYAPAWYYIYRVPVYTIQYTPVWRRGRAYIAKCSKYHWIRSAVEICRRRRRQKYRRRDAAVGVRGDEILTYSRSCVRHIITTTTERAHHRTRDATRVYTYTIMICMRSRCCFTLLIKPSRSPNPGAEEMVTSFLAIPQECRRPVFLFISVYNIKYT